MAGQGASFSYLRGGSSYLERTSVLGFLALRALGLARFLDRFVVSLSGLREVLLDIDVGQHRTGIAAGPAARQLYETIARSPGLKAAGLTG